MPPRPRADLSARLSRRERQILDVLYARGPSSAGEVCARLADAPSETAMRTLLRILEEKGHVRHERVGRRHVYIPTVRRETAQRSALRHVVATFFGGAIRDAVAALLDDSERELTAAERRELIALIRDARARGE
jgi:BlaI family transcriptional regulator, penicillinase repressor